MTKEDLKIGMEVFGFKFNGPNSDCGYTKKMDDYINQPGKIFSISSTTFQVKFENKEIWNYPIKEFLEQQTPIDLTELFNNIQKL
jgi:hypothetical protein